MTTNYPLLAVNEDFPQIASAERLRQDRDLTGGDAALWECLTTDFEALSVTLDRRFKGGAKLIPCGGDPRP